MSRRKQTDAIKITYSIINQEIKYIAIKRNTSTVNQWIPIKDMTKLSL